MTTVAKQELQFTRLADIPPAESTTTLLYGGSKTGKTDFMLTAGDRSLFINNGMGLETAFGKRFKERKVNPLIVTIPPDDKDDDERAYDKIKEVIEIALETRIDQFDTICIDDSSAVRKSTIIAAMLFNEAMGTSKTATKQNKYEISAPAVQDYGTEMEFHSKFLADTCWVCKQAGKHLIVGAHERLTFKKSPNIGDAPTLVRITPSFTGVDKNPDYISGLFDNVWHTEAVGGGTNTKFRIRTIGDESLTAGTRYSGIFKDIESDLRFIDVISRIKQFHSENK